MVHNTSSSSNPVLLKRKRKWKATHIVKIELGDDDEGTSTAVVHQASRNRRQLARQLHSIPTLHDPPSAGDLDFMMDMIGETNEEEPSVPVSPQVSSLISVPFV